MLINYVTCWVTSNKEVYSHEKNSINKQEIEKINQTKSYLFENINKIIKLLAGLSKEERGCKLTKL